MKILFFPKYTRLGASSRLRTYQYLPYFEEQGIKCEFSPLFDDDYLKRLYQKQKIGKLSIIKSYFLRLLKLFTLSKYDFIVVEKELFPYLPSFAEQVLALLKVKYVVDYDDAIFHNYDLHPNQWVRKLLSNKIARVMKSATLVVAGNSYLQSYAQKAGAKKVIVIPTVINTEHYKVKDHGPSEEVIVGWIGSPTTLKYVKKIVPVLRELSERFPLKLHIVGGKEGVGLKGKERVIEWSEAKEAELISQFDIGIMPLHDDAWEKGKCGYKLIQYMGCALPVIGSPVGVNNEIIQNGINGFKATDLDEWKHTLERLLADLDLRKNLGINGRVLVEEKYAYFKARDKWLYNLKEVHKLY